MITDIYIVLFACLNLRMAYSESSPLIFQNVMSGFVFVVYFILITAAIYITTKAAQNVEHMGTLTVMHDLFNEKKIN
jgi:hypothetical protein